MKRTLLAHVAGLVLPLAPLSGCSLDANDLAGKSCTRMTDCPSPYSCVETGPASRTCEIIQAPLTDAAPEVISEPADWCNDVKPLMVKYCSACHAQDTSGGVAGFRLHQYENAGPNGDEPGAKDRAARIKIRFADNFGQGGAAMPPPSFEPQPTKEETAVVTRWLGSQTPRVLEGRPDCADPF